jgi:protein-tyrosine phosphatase
LSAREIGLIAVSYGLHATDGATSPEGAIRAAKRLQDALAAHRATNISHFRPVDGDLVIAMEPAQLARLLPLKDLASMQFTLIGIWGKSYRPYLQDPFGLSDAYYSTCFGSIDDAVGEMKRRISATERR